MNTTQQQPAATDKQHPPNGGASSTNERPDGTGSRPLAAVASGASRNRSRSSRTNSKGVSSEEEMQAAKHVSRDQQKIPLGSGSETLPTCPAGKLRISSCDPRMPRGVTGSQAPYKIQINKGVPLQKSLGSGSETPHSTLASQVSISDTPPKAEDRILPTGL